LIEFGKAEVAIDIFLGRIQNDYHSHFMSVSQPTVIAIAGAAGVGKTTWVRQQLSQATGDRFYFCPGVGNVPIDLTQIMSEFPTIQVLTEQQEVYQLSAQATVYIELGFHLDLASASGFLDAVAAKRVAVLPLGAEKSDWHDWADQVVEGATIANWVEPSHLQRAVLTGQVFDPASLNLFWFELTEAAYGQICRAKGIFDLVDGRAVCFDFVSGLSGSTYTELNLHRWLDGRPERFSGIEVVGQAADQAAIAQTLADCDLSDAAIAHYQAQLKQSLGTEEAG
jgi:hypothetical protein